MGDASIFQQNNASVHTSTVTKLFLEANESR